MMLIVIYRRIPYFIVKSRAKRFFKNTPYLCRGNVYSFDEALITISVEKGEIFASLNSNEKSAVKIFFDFLECVFHNNEVSIYSKEFIKNNRKYHFLGREECKKIMD